MEKDKAINPQLEIVDSIESGKLDTAKDQVFTGIKQKSAEAGPVGAPHR